MGWNDDSGPHYFALVRADADRLGGCVCDPYSIQRVDRLHVRLRGAGLDAEAHDDAVWLIRNDTGWDQETAARGLREWGEVRRIVNGRDSACSRVGALRVYAKRMDKNSAVWVESLAKALEAADER